MVKNVKQYFLIAAEGTHRIEERMRDMRLLSYFRFLGDFYLSHFPKKIIQ